MRNLKAPMPRPRVMPKGGKAVIAFVPENTRTSYLMRPL